MKHITSTRRRFLKGAVGGVAIGVGMPFLDCDLDSSGTALAATGEPLPACFGTWIYSLGLNLGYLITMVRCKA